MKSPDHDNFRPFSEYREKDYRLPRSLKEAYGYEPAVYVEQEKSFFQRVVARVADTLMGRA